MVEIKNLCFSYQKNVPIFADFGWHVAQGEAWSIVGPSGCGKTTLLYLLAGLYPPSSGTIIIGGMPLDKPRLSTGLVLQDYGLLPWATAIDNISVGLRIRGVERKEATRVAREWLTRLALDSVAGHYPAQLSGGQRQRVAIARTLALQPDLLLMDEPLASLDAMTREDLQTLIIELRDVLPATAMVLVTHDIEEAVYLGKKILVLDNPPNTHPVIMENPDSGCAEYRRTPDYAFKCGEVRELFRQQAKKCGVKTMKVGLGK
ncbi:MAG: ABC transporter ATP-binding protein [Chloroflexota bacterium]